MKILNITQHKATPEQIVAGVIDLPVFIQDVLKNALNFNELPDEGALQERANAIAMMAKSHPSKARKAMIGGAPYLMRPLEAALRDVGIVPLYAFSVRESKEMIRDGVVQKVSVFKHLGFVGDYDAT